MTRHIWTAAEIEKLREIYPYMRSQDISDLLGITKASVLSKAWHLGIKKSREAIAKMSQIAMKDPNHPAHLYHFTKGHLAWNKGINFHSGGRSIETQFKRGRTPFNWKPIGHEKLSKEGYLMRKVTDTGLRTKDYIAVHRLVWLAAGNEIPPGHIVKFKDGDKTNMSIENLYLTSRAANMHQNSVHNYGPEVARIVQLQGAISRQINKRQGKTK